MLYEKQKTASKNDLRDWKGIKKEKDRNVGSRGIEWPKTKIVKIEIIIVKKWLR